MKVLLIDVNCKNSSTGNIVYNLYSYLNSTGNDAAICYGRGPRIKEKNIFKFGLDIETYLHAFLTRITGFTGCFSFFSTKRLIMYIRKYKPDVVHIHELHAYFVNIKPLISYLKKNRIKTIMTLHCEFIYTGKCGHSIECEQWKTECKNCPHLHEYVSTIWFDHTNYMFKQKKKLLENFDGLSIITPSEWLGKRVNESFLKNKPLKIIHNGIDTSVFFPRKREHLRSKLGIGKAEKVVLSVAPHLMTKEKGGLIVREIAARFKNKNVRFIMVGVDGVRCEYESNLIISGPIYDKNLLAEYYSLADVFLICSERENFPTTCIEAQCCGTPIYGFDTGGTRETCISEYNLVGYDDIDALEIAILDSPVKSKSTVDQLSGVARMKYSFDYFCKQTVSCYIGVD